MGKRFQFEERFFRHNGSAADEAFEVANYLASSFTVSGMTNPISNTDDEDLDEETPIQKGKIRIKHKINDIDVRRTVVDFGRCFGSGSIAGEALRNESSLERCIILRDALRRFGNCNHSAPRSDPGTCLDCALMLSRAGRKCIEYVPSASRLCLALSNANWCRSSSDIKTVAISASDLLHRAVEVRHEFYAKF